MRQDRNRAKFKAVSLKDILNIDSVDSFTSHLYV